MSEFIATTTAFITTMVQQYGGFGIFIGGALEEVISIIPASLVQMGGAAILMKGYALDFTGVLRLLFVVSIPGSLGVLLGSLPFYFLAYYGGESFLKKYGKYIGIKWYTLERIFKRFKKGDADEISLFIMRVIPFFPALAVNLFAGMTQIPFWKYVSITLVATIIRAFFVGLLGWRLAESRELFQVFIEKASGYITELIILLSLLGVLYIRFWYKKKKRDILKSS
jgi:membrane protein DedA with SNARE-associated domain